MKEVKEEKSFLTQNDINALNVLIQAVKIATTKGAFELEDAVVIGNAKSALEKINK